MYDKVRPIMSGLAAVAGLCVIVFQAWPTTTRPVGLTCTQANSALTAFAIESTGQVEWQQCNKVVRVKDGWDVYFTIRPYTRTITPAQLYKVHVIYNPYSVLSIDPLK